MPRYIAKYGRPLPHFMKYASPYYAKLKLSHTASNMNMLCRDLERWQRRIRFKRTDREFDHTIMLDPEIEVAPGIFDAMSRLYKSFCDDLKRLPEDIRDFTEEERKQAYIDLYDFYRVRCLAACGYDVRVVANAAVELCHQHPSCNQKFQWIVGGPGIVENIQQTDIVLPDQDDNGELKYLGKNYKMTAIKKEDVIIE